MLLSKQLVGEQLPELLSVYRLSDQVGKQDSVPVKRMEGRHKTPQRGGTQQGF